MLWSQVHYQIFTAESAEVAEFLFLAADLRRQAQTIIHPATKIGGQARHKDRRASAEAAEVAEM